MSPFIFRVFIIRMFRFGISNYKSIFVKKKKDKFLNPNYLDTQIARFAYPRVGLRKECITYSEKIR